MTFLLDDDEARRLVATHATLEEHGVLAGEADYDVSTLAAAIYARQWSYSLDRSGADFRATISTSNELHRGIQAVGLGWSLEVALATALANAFAAGA